jgi:hypothetical protein
VGTRNQKDIVGNLIFPFGSREKDYLKEKKHGLPEIDFYNIQLEEKRDKELIDSIFKKYSSYFQFILRKYSGAGFSTRSKEEL